VVDPLGNLIHMVVHAAHVHDTKGACEVLEAEARKHATIQAFSGGAGYRGTAVEFVETTLGLRLDISQRIKDTLLLTSARTARRSSLGR
jgi:putative transposase